MRVELSFEFLNREPRSTGSLAETWWCSGTEDESGKVHAQDNEGTEGDSLLGGLADVANTVWTGQPG